MLALAAAPLGVRCTVYDPGADPCAGQICPALQGEYDDFARLYELAQASDVITYEFENVPVETVRWLNERVPVYPSAEALEVSQDRINEKTFFANLGIPTPPFAAVDTESDFRQALVQIGLPAVLKTRRFGYDGKGQAVLRSPAEADDAWQRLGGRPLILEGFVPFDRELSLVAVRDRLGGCRFYPLTENHHAAGMLRTSIAPAPRLGEELFERAAEMTHTVLEKLNYVGVLAIEWFQDGSRLIANEMAPRVHNSGHWTIEGAVTSQFSNHIRAVCGWPLGDATARGHAVMLNLIGKQPDWAEVLGTPGTQLHWYGKEPRALRKVGHITLTGTDAEELPERAGLLEAKLGLLQG
jgi:5-(carboxyamino)imidazole ribonucleotide synthase